MRHEPLTRAEAAELWANAQERKADREKTMPDEKAALQVMFNAWLRLKELGWREAMYCPKDGSTFKVIEAGSTGIHDCSYRGSWPNGSFDVFDGGDVWPSHPILFRLNPEDEAKEKARWAEAKARYEALPTCKVCGLKLFDVDHEPCDIAECPIGSEMKP